jgi:hypothetical protein
MTLSLPVHANDDDRKCAHALIDAILAGGNSVTVWEGGDYAIKRGKDKTEILTEMASTGFDEVVAVSPEGKKLGGFHLIYCNGSEGEPMVLIADHDDNDYCNAIYEAVSQKIYIDTIEARANG